MQEDTLEIFDAPAKALSKAKDQLADRIADLDAQVTAIYRRRMPGIRTAVKQVEDAKDALKRIIDANRGHFQKPRSCVLHGIKLGLQKGKGAIEWDDDVVLIKRIRKQHPEQLDLLVKVTETPIKGGLQQLTTAELKKLGCRVEESGDAVLIKINDGPLQKLLKSILKDGGKYDPEEEVES